MQDFLCEIESFNDVDKYVIAVLKDDTIVGYTLKRHFFVIITV